MKAFEVDERIAHAETPPGEAYCSQSVFNAEIDSIFSRSWLGVPAVSDALSWVEPFQLLPGAMDESLVFTRDAKGTEAILSNVCTHRGMQLSCEPRNAKRLRCMYHGRRFSMSGALEAAPGFDGAEDFPRPQDDLASLPLEYFGPIAFTAIQPTLDFATWLAPVKSWMRGLDVSALRFKADETKRYRVAANWKLYLDNYLEGFHIRTVHRSLAAALDVNGYETRLLSHGSLQIGRVNADEPALKLADDHPLAGERIGALYFHLFPNTLINVYPWGLSINHVNPISVDQTEVIFRSYYWDESLRDQGAGADLHRVELEDEAVVEAVQKGIRSRLYTRGRYAPKQEEAVHHFHRLWVGQVQ